MSSWVCSAEVTQSSPLISITPTSAKPPHGHFTLMESATIVSDAVSNAMFGRLCKIAVSLSRFDVSDASEALPLEDFAKLLRVRSPFAIDKRCPAVNIALRADGSYVVTPMIRNGLGKSADRAKAMSISPDSSDSAVGEAVRNALRHSESSLSAS